MWQHSATQANVSLLRQRQVEFVGPADGLLSCGYEGLGRLETVEKIVDMISTMLK
jgi:phosphopantothenoylcysteine synthetase/decarboxylase